MIKKPRDEWVIVMPIDDFFPRNRVLAVCLSKWKAALVGWIINYLIDPLVESYQFVDEEDK